MNKNRITVPKASAEEGIGSTLSFRKPWEFRSDDKDLMHVKIKKEKRRATVGRQPTPIHDWINFKEMSGNEILINLNNVENLGQYEMLAGLLQLAKHKHQHQHDWNTNPITAKCIASFN